MALHWTEYSARRAGEHNARHDNATVAGLAVVIMATVAILATILIMEVCSHV